MDSSCQVGSKGERCHTLVGQGDVARERTPLDPSTSVVSVPESLGQQKSKEGEKERKEREKERAAVLRVTPAGFQRAVSYPCSREGKARRRRGKERQGTEQKALCTPAASSGRRASRAAHLRRQRLRRARRVGASREQRDGGSQRRPRQLGERGSGAAEAGPRCSLAGLGSGGSVLRASSLLLIQWQFQCPSPVMPPR
jgi:hypothetical protein